MVKKIKIISICSLCFSALSFGIYSFLSSNLSPSSASDNTNTYTSGFYSPNVKELENDNISTLTSSGLGNKIIYDHKDTKAYCEADNTVWRKLYIEGVGKRKNYVLSFEQVNNASDKMVSNAGICLLSIKVVIDVTFQDTNNSVASVEFSTRENNSGEYQTLGETIINENKTNYEIRKDIKNETTSYGFKVEFVVDSTMDESPNAKVTLSVSKFEVSFSC